MSTLYIIGNGFDRAHGLKTTYWDFRNYLEKYAGDFLTKLENMYSIEPFIKLDKRIKKNKDIQNRRDKEIFELLWKNFEFSLGEVNEAEMLDFSKSIVDGLYLDGDPIGIKDTMDIYWDEQYRFIKELNDYVAKWIRQVRLFKAKPINTVFEHNSRDYFFTFNYTNVLEYIYQIPSSHILHIHGGLPPYCETLPILGHGNAEKFEEFRKKAKNAAEEPDEEKESIYNAIANYYERTWKNTNKCMASHGYFFQELKNVDNIEIIGHSYGEVDLPYFNFLKYQVLKKAKWKLFYFNAEDYAAANIAVEELELDTEDYKIVPSIDFWKSIT